ncbi:MAG: hypothetical protein QME55_03825 [Brevundimonas sp.]|uniref:hypothetical protein n=1 Tax=Brevundimonas sp. TaxID=1871086 RepID=UPI00262292DE|nr:hypothetical protein [Brevundimonas sp.]MDI6623835.1 hypothetical protein [Brevundimonas sp.]MDQ7812996.1 hypothetical protein [Brevundimonas sp.]
MPRDRRRQITDRDFIRALQHLRLKGLETGRFQPMSEREEFYLRLFRDGHRPDPEDFILPRPLFHLEAMARRTEEADPAPPFTPSPETAISRA